MTYSVAERETGLLDTNVVIHAFASDSLSDECERFLRALREGQLRAILEPVVVHELTYALPHFVQQMTRSDVAAFLLDLIGWEAVQADKANLARALEHWRDSPGLGFVDAYLGALALSFDQPVFSKNVRDFARFGARVADPLPG